MGRPHLPQKRTRDAFSARDSFSKKDGSGARFNVSELPKTARERPNKGGREMGRTVNEWGDLQEKMARMRQASKDNVMKLAIGRSAVHHCLLLDIALHCNGEVLAKTP